MFIRTLLFYMGYFLYTLIFGPVCLIICWLSFPFTTTERRFKILTSWVDVIMFWLSLTCNIKFEVIGKENIPTIPCVILSNHQSTWETLYLYKLFKPQTTLLKRELLWIPIFGWGLKMLNPIAINRGNKSAALKQLLSEAPKKINEGYWFVAFPEGTRVGVNEVIPYASGSSLIASKGCFDVLPIAHNAGKCWPGKKFRKASGTITLSIGPVISSSGKKSKALTSEVENWIRAEQAKLG